MRFLPIFLSLLAFTSPALALVKIKGSKDLQTIEKLQDTATEALHKFEDAFGPLTSDIEIDLESNTCLRVGYDFQNTTVRFCDIKHVKSQGLESVDVIRHELFHAMICQKYPAICSQEFLNDINNQALHESLADFFAYTLSPDNNFGEDFYTSGVPVRNYKTDFCYSLVTSAYDKANALVSNFIENKLSLSDFSLMLKKQFNVSALIRSAKAPCFDLATAPQFSLVPVSVPLSNLNRYRIELGESLRLVAEANNEFKKNFKSIRLEWQFPQSDAYELSEVAPQEYTVRALAPGRFIETKLLIFENERLIGKSSFYFGQTLKSSN